jgi:hypothetical protein
VSSPRRLLGRALNALEQVEERAGEFADAREELEAALGPPGRLPSRAVACRDSARE